MDMDAIPSASPLLKTSAPDFPAPICPSFFKKCPASQQSMLRDNQRGGQNEKVAAQGSTGGGPRSQPEPKSISLNYIILIILTYTIYVIYSK